MATNRIENPLDKFQSYSTHFIMAACRSTEDLHVLTDDNPFQEKRALEIINEAKFLGDSLNVNSNPDSAFLLIDTRRFAQYTVDNYSLTTKIHGFAIPGSKNPSSTGSTLSFDIIDATGISFANFLQWIQDAKLKVGLQGLIFVMKVIFVGHSQDNTTSTIQTISIPFSFKKMEMEMTDVYGHYRCEAYPLVGLISNSEKNPEWTRIGTASSYFSGEKINTLGAMVNAFEKELNYKALEAYAKRQVLNVQAGGTFENGVLTPSNVRYGRPVKYLITVPSKWENFTFAGANSNSSEETNFKEQFKKREAATTKQMQDAVIEWQKKNPGKDFHMSVDTSSSITDVLTEIFKQVPQIAELGNFKKQSPDQPIEFFKYLISVTSSSEDYLVHIDVIEYVVPNVYLQDKQAKSNTVAESMPDYFTKDDDGLVVPKNFIEYDYLFSGTNVDVIHLDIKLENLVYVLASRPAMGGDLLAVKSDAGQNQQDATVAPKVEMLSIMRQNDPVYIQPRTELEKTNASSLSAADSSTTSQLFQEYTKNLAMFYSAGHATHRMEIRGNPDIFYKFALQKLPPHANNLTIDANSGVSSINVKSKADYREALLKSLENDEITTEDGKLVVGLSGPSIMSSPVFAKVNVYTTNYDFLAEDARNGADFRQPFLKDNYFWVSEVVNKISGGTFTQELEMRTYASYGVPKFGGISK
jgi:hypothetical protein